MKLLICLAILIYYSPVSKAWDEDLEDEINRLEDMIDDAEEDRERLENVRNDLEDAENDLDDVIYNLETAKDDLESHLGASEDDHSRVQRSIASSARTRRNQFRDFLYAKRVMRSAAITLLIGSTSAYYHEDYQRIMKALKIIEPKLFK